MLAVEICRVYHTGPMPPGSAPGKPKLFIMKPSRAWGLLWLNGSWQQPQGTKIAGINPCAQLVFFPSLLSQSPHQCRGELASHSLQTWSLVWQLLESTGGMAWHKNGMLHDQIQHNNFIHDSTIGLVTLDPGLQTGCRKGLSTIINVCPSGLTKP